jgi:hypothetical protein
MLTAIFLIGQVKLYFSLLKRRAFNNFKTIDSKYYILNLRLYCTGGISVCDLNIFEK